MFEKIYSFIVLKLISNINWTRIKFLWTGREYNLRAQDRERARDLMIVGVYLWVSRRNAHLTTYLINWLDFILSLFGEGKAKKGYYSHAFMNINDDELIEATSHGVIKSYFDDVFNCDSVAAMRPKGITLEQWEQMYQTVKNEMQCQLGKKYDSVFNLNDSTELSCIELVRLVLMNGVPDYHLKFANLENMIKNYKNITPQMLYDSGDFVIVWEVRR